MQGKKLSLPVGAILRHPDQSDSEWQHLGGGEFIVTGPLPDSIEYLAHPDSPDLPAPKVERVECSFGPGSDRERREMSIGSHAD